VGLLKDSRWLSLDGARRRAEYKRGRGIGPADSEHSHL